LYSYEYTCQVASNVQVFTTAARIEISSKSPVIAGERAGALDTSSEPAMTTI